MYNGTLPTISNRADWIGTLELVNDDTEELVTDLSGVTFKLELRDNTCRSTLLTATFENGKAVATDQGIIQWQFPASDLSRIAAGSYEVGIIVTRDGVTEQELIAIQPILDGVVR
ncbi:hypothetical protein [Agrobacterium tumefaciens]|uniref:hypothetical protein n=1 Tax=Agrobacterium tumefaciens TaxID=358 RepID=UPI003BA31C75